MSDCSEQAAAVSTSEAKDQMELTYKLMEIQRDAEAKLGQLRDPALQVTVAWPLHGRYVAIIMWPLRGRYVSVTWPRRSCGSCATRRCR